MGRLDNRLPTNPAWLDNEVLARRIWPWCGSKEARTRSI
jgi:hypothetical protein